MTIPDLEQITADWLQQCGSCDAGLPATCTCPASDPRVPIGKLADEILRLRTRIAAARETCDEAIAHYRTPELPDSYSTYAEGQCDLADRIDQLLEGSR